MVIYRDSHGHLKAKSNRNAPTRHQLANILRKTRRKKALDQYGVKKP